MDAYEEALETPYLKQAPNEIDFDYIGWIQSIDFLPWCFKFLLAIPSDSINFFGYGHRRPFVVIGLVLGGVSFCALSFFSAKIYKSVPYMLVMILRNIGIGIADCAVDGFSVDAGIDSESGSLQGWMSLGRTLGTVVACIASGKVAKYFHDKELAAGAIGTISSYQWGILVSAVIVFVPIPFNYFIVEEWDDSKVYADKIQSAADIASRDITPAVSPNSVSSQEPLLVNEPTMPMYLSSSSAVSTSVNDNGDNVKLAPIRAPSEGEAGKAQKLARRPSFVARVAVASGFDFELLCEVVGQRHVWMFLTYLFLTTAGVAVANFSLSSWLVDDLNFSEEEIGEAMSVMSVGCFAISLPLGYAFDAIPYKRSLLFLAAASCAGCNLALAFCNTKPLAMLGLLGFGAAHGAIFVVQNSMARILADSRIAAVFFGIVNSVCNSAHFMGTLVTGYIVSSSLDPLPRAWSVLEITQPIICIPQDDIPLSVFDSHTDVFAQCSSTCVGAPSFGRCEYECVDECPPFENYNLSYYAATAIDIVATLFVFLIPGDKLTVKESHLGLRILPHRANLAFVEPSVRATARNTTAASQTKKSFSSLPAVQGVGEYPPVPMSAALSLWLQRTGRSLTGSGTTVFSGAATAISTAPPYSSVHGRLLEAFGLRSRVPSGILGVLMTKKEAEARARPITSPQVRSRRTSVGEALRGLNNTGSDSVLFNGGGGNESGGDDTLVTTTSLMARLAAIQPYTPSRGGMNMGDNGGFQSPDRSSGTIGTSSAVDWEGSLMVNPLARMAASATTSPNYDNSSPKEWAPGRR